MQKLRVLRPTGHFFAVVSEQPWRYGQNFQRSFQNVICCSDLGAAEVTACVDGFSVLVSCPLIPLREEPKMGC